MSLAQMSILQQQGEVLRNASKNCFRCTQCGYAFDAGDASSTQGNILADDSPPSCRRTRRNGSTA